MLEDQKNYKEHSLSSSSGYILDFNKTYVYHI